MWGNTLPKNPFLRFCVLMAHRYNKHNVAIQSADIALMNNDLNNIPFVMSLARSTKSIMYQNIGIAFSVSLIMMILAAVGVIPALAGAFLHNIGAFVILINSSRILRDSGGEG